VSHDYRLNLAAWYWFIKQDLDAYRLAFAHFEQLQETQFAILVHDRDDN
jgi:hypothetical protein